MAGDVWKEVNCVALVVVANSNGGDVVRAILFPKLVSSLNGVGELAEKEFNNPVAEVEGTVSLKLES